MKGQQLFHTFLPGVTAAVLTTQPAWAGTVEVSSIQPTSSPNVLAFTEGHNLVADNTNMQLPKTASQNFSDNGTVSGLNTFYVPTLTNNSNPVILTGNAGVAFAQLTQKQQSRAVNVTPTSKLSQHSQQQNSTKVKKTKKLAAAGQKSNNGVVNRATSQFSTIPPTTFSLAATPQSAPRQNLKTQLAKVLPTVVKGTGAAQLLAVRSCSHQMGISNNLSLYSRGCGEPKVTEGLTAQNNTSETNSTPVPTDPSSTPAPVEAAPANTVPTNPSSTPAPVEAAPANTVPTNPSSTPNESAPAASPNGVEAAPTAPVPSNASPAPAGAVQIPENLIPSSNPLQFPTKPEEVTVQGNQPITLEQALELARRNNRELQVSVLQLERSRAALRESQAALYPTLDINADVTRSQSASSQLRDELSGRAGVPSNEDEPGNAFNGQAQLTYNLYTSGQRRANIKEAEEQVRFNELDVERQSEEIRLNVSIDYFDLQGADEQVRIAQSSVANAQASLRDAEALERAGVGTRFDVLRSQVNLANAQQDLITAISQQQIARRQLATRLSLPQTVTISAADPVQLAGLWNRSLEESIVLAFQNRPELQQQLAQRNISEQQRRQALATLGPQLSFIANYNLLDQFDDSVSVTDGYSVGLRASLNLFDGGAARARAAQARSNIAIAETQFGEQRNQIRFQVEQAFATQQSNLENVTTANTALEQAREALRLARLRFQAGVGTQTDVINSENDLTRAEGNRVTAILEYNRALARLQRSVTTRAFR
ncbi:TolC family protein [Nostoc sp. FACHB-152]|uniref:TolC family protein n=1 Tax=unclassified Nostoc TaxID=2593658 RepID=UPI0016898B24|nr:MULTISPECIES: TolC family protein [unclassified Nostoc]MBD2448211.1 TolC family protein [Nostoc sp. FACHB-152]MBD2469231.1 TolC family protein [Nostoc sp. FACHB-145]